MKPTLRDYLSSKFESRAYNAESPADHELLSNSILDYLSSNGMEWTEDDVKVIEEYGACAQDYLCFDDEQESKIDDVYQAAEHLISVMVTDFREHNEPREITINEMNIAKELADIAADLLTKAGIDAYFPVHVECGDGTEYISDTYERRND